MTVDASTAPTTAAPLADPDSRLVRELGVRQLAANIFNYTVGASIFALPAFAAAQLGSAALAAYLVCAVVMALVVLVFAEAGSRVSKTGGPYTYVEVGLGPLPGLISGLLMMVNDLSAVGAIAMLLAGLLARVVGLSGALPPRVIAVLLIGALAVLNIRGVRLGARIVEVSTLAKLVPLLFFVLVGAFFVSPSHLRWVEAPNIGKVARTAGTLIFAFTGIEAALLPSGEVRDTARTVPRASMIALGAATLLYIAIQAVAVGVMGPKLADDTVTPLATTAAHFAGRVGFVLLLSGAAISTFGWLTGALLAAPRALFALARDGFLPRRLSDVHPRFRTPHIAIATFALVAVALAISGTFERLVVVSNLAALGVYFMSAIAVWAMRLRGIRGEGEPFVIPGGATVPVLACAATAWVAAATVTRPEVAAFGFVIVVSILLYGVSRGVSRRGLAAVSSSGGDDAHGGLG